MSVSFEVSYFSGTGDGCSSPLHSAPEMRLFWGKPERAGQFIAVIKMEVHIFQHKLGDKYLFIFSASSRTVVSE